MFWSVVQGCVPPPELAARVIDELLLPAVRPRPDDG
jgi:hypothetical protein